MSQKTYRVIQWATGVVGKTALRHFIENPAFELVGVLVTKPEKVGLDAGDIVGLPKTGVLATDDVEAIMSLEADCVLFAPIVTNVDTICRLLRSGKNVASVAGPFSPQHYPEHFAKIEAACRDGSTSYHGCGIHPGFSGDLLPLTLTRLMNRVDHIQVYEFIDKLRNPMVYTEMMGFGRDPEALLAKPSRSPEAPYAFAQSMALVAEGLGKQIEKVTTRLEVAKATQDIPYSLGIGLPISGTIRKGTVAGQHYEWTAWADGKPLITYHFYWTMGENVEPRWDIDSRYQVVIEGDPPLEVRLMSRPDSEGVRPFLGLPWTGLLGATALPAICDAAPGVITHLDLGVVQPRGLVR
jgi:2,4-diaminopentanoate dehydrogenase